MFLKSRQPRFIGEAYEVAPVEYSPIDASITNVQHTDIPPTYVPSIKDPPIDAPPTIPIYVEGGEDVNATPPDYDMCCVNEAPHAYWAKCVADNRELAKPTSVAVSASFPTPDSPSSLSHYTIPGPITRWNPSVDNCTLKGDAFHFSTDHLHVNRSLLRVLGEKFPHVNPKDVDYACEGTLMLKLPV